MQYKILDTSLAKQIHDNYHLPEFCAKVLASYPKAVIKDVLTYQPQPVIFEQMLEALNLIKKHLNKNNKIMIMGDYDCDGILATSIMVKAFAKLGHKVGYYIPNRISDGYGLNDDIVNQVINKEYDLIISVDNGINAQSSINLALENNIDVIITDHHNLEEDKQTNALYIHPTYSNLNYPVSGGVVAFYLASALLDFEDDYLQALAGITLISDVIPLIKGNRPFVRKSLKNLNTQDFLQITALATGYIDSAMLANMVVPKINSLGRLPDFYNPNNLVKYFCSNERNNILNYAKVIEECNNKRKDMSQDYVFKYDNEPENNLMMLIEDELHEGIMGLLASRFTHKYNCISFIGTKNDGITKASIRSLDNVNIYDILSKRADLFDKLGGHKNAMGVSFKTCNYPLIKEYLETSLAQIDHQDKIYDVIKLSESDLSVTNVKNLRLLEPFGNGFAQPLFLMKNLLVLDIKSLKGGLHYKVSALFEKETFDLLFFNNSNLEIKKNDSLDIIVKLSLNNFRNVESVNLIVENYQVNVNK